MWIRRRVPSVVLRPRKDAPAQRRKKRRQRRKKFNADTQTHILGGQFMPEHLEVGHHLSPDATQREDEQLGDDDL